MTEGTDGVRYTIKELIAELRGELRESLIEIKSELRAINSGLADKVGREEHEALRMRVAALELVQSKQAGESQYKRWVIPLVVVVAVGVLTVLVGLLAKALTAYQGAIG